MTLWTPSGEHPVDRGDKDRAPRPSGDSPPPGGVPDEPSLEDLSPEQRAQVEEMSRQMEAAQARMLAMPAGVVVGQQALQFYELAALYLSQDPPRLQDARTAIDALLAVADKLGTRLGEAEQPLRQALNQLQLAYVQVANAAEAPVAAEEPAAAEVADEPTEPAEEPAEEPADEAPSEDEG